jgi:hypothetical protein
VKDPAGLFTPKAIEKADREIEQIRQIHKKQLIILTRKEPPEEWTEKHNLDDAKDRRHFFKEWIRYEMSSYKDFDGIFVLISEKPEDIEIYVSPDTEPYFGEWYQKELFKILAVEIQPDNPRQSLFREVITRFNLHKQRGNDYALITAIDFVRRKLDWNTPVEQDNWVLGLGAIGGLLVLWVFLGILRNRLRKRTPASAGVQETDDSGRSIGVLGGGIGAITGQWLASLLFGPREPAPTVTATAETAGHSGELSLPEQPPQESAGER